MTDSKPPRTDLSRFLNPRGIAVVGVSAEPTRIGGQALKLLTDFGYQGKIYPVNPRYPEVHGLKCYPDLLAVPQPCDVALIALSAAQAAGAVEQAGRAGIPFALVLAGGYSETGAEGKALQEQLVAAARKANVRMVGPNCLGILNLKDNARIGFGGTAQLKTLKPGPMAMVTQSGGFGFGVVAVAAYFGVGCNYAISSGNEADLTLLDWVADLSSAPKSRSSSPSWKASPTAGAWWKSASGHSSSASRCWRGKSAIPRSAAGPPRPTRRG